MLWAACALAASIVTSQVVQVATHPETMDAVTLATSALVLGVAVALVRLPTAWTAPFVLLAPLLGVAAIVALDLLSRDATFTGLAFFVIPAVYAAALLRAGAIAVVCLATTAGGAVTVFSLLPASPAAVDLAYLAVLVVLISTVLGRTAAQHDALVLRLRTAADTDPLTGLATRRVLDAATADLGGGRSGSPTGGGALLLVDLDRFKSVNDTYGHLSGDAALTHVAEVLRSACRGDDLAARMGGDELAVLLVGCTPEDATRRAHDVVDPVRTTPLVLSDGTRVPLSVSVGVAPVHVLSRTSEDLYARADEALYAAKRAGRDRAVTASA